MQNSSFTPYGLRKDAFQTVKTLVSVTAGASLGAAACEGLTHLIPPHFMPSFLLSLSASGIQSGKIWQLFTYIFLQNGAATSHGGITFAMLIGLFFSCYMLWIAGSFISAMKGPKHFLAIYFLAALAGGVGAYAAQKIFHIPYPYSGNSAITFSLLLAWVCFNAETQFHLFMTIPMRAKTLFIGLFWMMMLIDLSGGDFISLFARLSALLAVYLYTTLIWKIATPFKPLLPLDKLLITLSGSRSVYKSAKQSYSKAKIFEFSTGEAILTDAQHLDSLREKIALHGIKSLSLRERIKLFFLELRLR